MKCAERWFRRRKDEVSQIPGQQLKYSQTTENFQATIIFLPSVSGKVLLTVTSPWMLSFPGETCEKSRYCDVEVPPSLLLWVVKAFVGLPPFPSLAILDESLVPPSSLNEAELEPVEITFMVVVVARRDSFAS